MDEGSHLVVGRECVVRCPIHIVHVYVEDVDSAGVLCRRVKGVQRVMIAIVDEFLQHHYHHQYTLPGIKYVRFSVLPRVGVSVLKV